MQKFEVVLIKIERYNICHCWGYGLIHHNCLRRHHRYRHLCHHHHPRHHHHHHHLCLLLLVMPLTGPETDPGVSGLLFNCLKEVIELATLNPLCYPNSYLAELQSDPLSLLFTAGAWLLVCHKSSTTAPILNLCKMTRYQLKGSVSLCPPTTTRRSPTMGGPSSSSLSSSSSPSSA